jgi:Zn finger protein HypA/HybF involved in hydrogenase expression
MATSMRPDPFDPFVNVVGFVRECWCCGHVLTRENDHLHKCPVCDDARLVPFGSRFELTVDFLY